MSLHRRAARRDDNEQAIAEALIAAGASVTYLSEPGCPDLLVGVAGRTLLIEVKRERGPRGGKRGGGRSRPGMGGDGELTADQIDWRAAWRGSPPVIVRTPADALAAIGAAPATIAEPAEPVPATPPPAPTWRCSGCELVYPDADGLELEAGVAPPIHWTETPTRPWPLCTGFGKPGVPLAAIGAAS